MSEDNGDSGYDTQIYLPCLVYLRIKAHEKHKRNGHKTFEEVDYKDRNSSAFTKHAKHICSAGILAAVFSNIYAIIFLANPYGTRYRTEQIGDDSKRDCTIVCKYSPMFHKRWYDVDC